MRAFRPSRFGMMEEAVVDPAEQLERVVKIRVYAQRAKAHQPLFQEKPEPHPHLGEKEG